MKFSYELNLLKKCKRVKLPLDVYENSSAAESTVSKKWTSYFIEGVKFQSTENVLWSLWKKLY